MAIFICDISASDFWFGDRASPHGAVCPLATVPSFRHADASAKAFPVEQLAQLGFDVSAAHPIHLAVPEPRMLRHTRALKTHLQPNPPPGTFVRLSKDVYIESPAASLVRTSTRIPNGKLLKLVLQALGSFCRVNGATIDCTPLLSLSELARYLQGVKHVPGVAKLRRILPYALEGAASIRECEVIVLLVLPPRLGGRGLPIPLLNHRIDARRSALGITRYADLCWIAFRLILEYDSDEFHAIEQKLGLDSARRTQLQLEDYTVVSLTNYQLKRRAEFEDVVNTLLKHLNMQPQTLAVPDFATRESQLRRDVLGFDWVA